MTRYRHNEAFWDGQIPIYRFFALTKTNQPVTKPTNLHRVVGYGPFSLCVIHKEGLCPSSVDINRLMMKTDQKA
jgi:hypothetical protein